MLGTRKKLDSSTARLTHFQVQPMPCHSHCLTHPSFLVHSAVIVVSEIVPSNPVKIALAFVCLWTSRHCLWVMKGRGLCLNVHKWTTPTTTNVISCMMAPKLLKYSSGMVRFLTTDRWWVPLLSLGEGRQFKYRVRAGPRGIMLFEGRLRGSYVVWGHWHWRW
jgi:hypothetical protein